MLYIGARIYTMDDDNKIIECGAIRTENGKIAYVGEMIDALPGEETVALHGKTVYPGLIDGHTHIGLIGDAEKFESEDINEITDPVTPHLRAIDALNPLDRTFREAIDGGITTVCTGPGSANPIGGQTCLIETAGKRADDVVIKAPFSIKFALGENPKMCYHGRKQTPETRMGTAAIIRETLTKAKIYNNNKTKYEQGVTDKEPEFNMKLEALRPLMNKEIPAHIHAHKAADIFTAIRIAKEFDINYVLVHCTEGHLIADELKGENVTAFIGPNLTDRSKPELKNLEFVNAARLKEKGITFGLTTDHPVTNVQYLPMCAALAHKCGLPYMDAVRAMTADAAKVLGIEDLKGSLKIGLDADFIVTDGDILQISTNIERVYIRDIRVK